MAGERTYRLKSKEKHKPEQGMRRIAVGRAQKASERLHEAQRSEDPSDCLHGVRKDLKKSRAVLRLLRHELGESRYRDENNVYRDAGRLLSHTRDAEVKVKTLESLCGRYVGTLPAGAAAEWLQALREERNRA